MQLERKFFTQEDLPVCEECYKVSLDHGGDFDVKYGDDSMLVIVAILMLVMVFDVWFVDDDDDGESYEESSSSGRTRACHIGLEAS